MIDNNLFWYPDRANKGKDYDKDLMLEEYVLYFLNRLQSMFSYDGLPETIPAKWLEHYLLTNGNCIIAKDDEDRLIAYVGNQGTRLNVYYIPCGYIVANPYFNKGIIATDDLSSKGFSKTFNIGVDCEIIYNDTYSMGMLPMLRKYGRKLVENDITLDIADILARATINISTSDDKTKASAELYLSNLREGKLGVMSTNAFIEGLNISNFGNVAASITSLIEYHQYIKASLYNEIGLNSNYNMKRESINSKESQLNDDMLHPLIDTMLRERQEALNRVNTMFGTNITVKFNSAWLANEMEEIATHNKMEAEAIAEEVAIVEEVTGGTTESEDISNNDDITDSNMDNSDNVSEVVDLNDVKAESEDTITEDVTTEDGITSEEVEKAEDVIEEVVEVFEDIETNEDTKEDNSDGTSED